MAQVAISGWRKERGKPHAGVIKLLRDYCGMDFDTAHRMSVKLIAGGTTHWVDVPFGKRDAFIRELAARGFPAS